ncbi:MAG: ABC transporter ATP-binding protein [Alphaproteobacteria bacterium PA4]|nr:MAG: ABC transporter ATP-binding protein [Alphaproteobacteria bacterium PA4]
MIMAADNHQIRLRDVFRWVGPILGPERNFFWLAIVYGLGISLLTLAVPVSVQLLINSIANTALPAPLFTLAAVLFVLLLLSGVLGLFRAHLMEIFRRRFVARLVADVTMKTINAANPFFQDERRIDLFNRYFELINVQKAIPSLLIGGFTIILQAAVGFVVTAFYHPFFLAFNIIVVLLVWLIWAIWARGAMLSSITLSHQKYYAAHWLESVGASNGFYKSARHLDYAIEKSDEVSAKYVAAHRLNYRYTLPQNIALMLLYAAASAGLLALGGWLVIQEQLSIGQLVAAELILSGAFYGVAQLGTYLDSFYTLVASVEELALLYGIPQEPAPDGRSLLAARGAALGLSNVRFQHISGPVRFDLEIPEGARLVAQGSPGMEREFSSLLKRLLKPDNGIVTLGGVDIAAMDILQLRSDVIVLDRPYIVESSVIDYLRLSSPDGDPAAILDALELVGLADRIAMLPDGLQTTLSSTGWPLSLAKTMQLKLAAAVLAPPRILVLSPLFDVVAADRLQRVFDHLAGQRTTLIYFSNRPEAVTLDDFLWLGRDSQAIVASRGEFDTLRRQGRGEVEHG